MRVIRLELRHFRGFRSAVIHPAGHVVLMGEPGSGRTDVIEALSRVLTPESLRFHAPDEMDFYQQDLETPAEVEVTLGDLSDAELATFSDHSERWDRKNKQLIETLPRPQLLDDPNQEWVVRLCYRAEWNSERERVEHWVHYPVSSDPDNGWFDKLGASERDEIPFATPVIGGRVLDLAAGGSFRRLVEVAGSGFPEARDELQAKLKEIAAEFASTEPIKNALAKIAAPLNGMPRAGDDLATRIRFLPEGGSITGLFRSLAPALELSTDSGMLPLARHGSTLSGLLEVSQSLAHLPEDGGIFALDDFGENIDIASAQHIAANLRRSVSQFWVSTRRAGVAEVFRPEELIRLSTAADDERVISQRTPGSSREERSVARRVTLQLLPHLTSRAVVILEGPHDWAAISALAVRLQEDEGVALPSLYGVGLVDAGESGGVNEVSKLGAEARKLGLRVVAVIDGDPLKRTQSQIREVLSSAHAVIRLPQDFAIEFALIHGLDEELVKAILGKLKATLIPKHDVNFEALQGKALRAEARKFLKAGGGLHAQFVDYLEDSHPPVARRILEKAIEAATTPSLSGLIQLEES